MARRSDHTKVELKKLIIEAGSAVMAQGGLRDFSGRQIAKDIGYTIGTIHNMFGGNDMLILHINAATLSEMHGYLQGHMHSCDAQGIARLKYLAQGYVNYATAHANRWHALYEFSLPQQIAQQSDLPDWYVAKINALFTLVETTLQQTLPAQEVEETAKVIWASVTGICRLGMTGKLDIVGAKIIVHLVDTLITNYFEGVQDA